MLSRVPIRRRPEIVLDLSRLLSRILHVTPTGVDRCEMAYARELIRAVPERLSFGAVHPLGGYGRLAPRAVFGFLDATERRWESLGASSGAARRTFALKMLASLRPQPVPAGPGPRVYLQASPNNLTRPALLARILRRERARFICLVHDLIPLEYPEYARPEGAEQHRARITTIAAYADGIVTNSHATLDSLRPWLNARPVAPKTVVAHLGTHLRPSRARTPDPAARPYFVCIGTIEPRKNHLLLLNIWRRLSETYGPSAVPKLLIIGRRGWENEQVVDMLDRCEALHGCVEELGGLPDEAVHRLLEGARALLLPSFAEGYGMPVTEALAVEVPVLCSDLPALREAGGAVPEYLDPLDGPSWMRRIVEYARSAAPTKAQRERMQTWSAPTWADHVAKVLQKAEEVVDEFQ